MRNAQTTSETRIYEDPHQGAPSARLGYGLALASVILMALVRLALNPWLEEQSRFVLFLPAIMIASWYGGRRSALLALALGAGFGITLFFSMPHSTHAQELGDLFSLALYLMAGLMIMFVNERQQREKVRAEESRLAAEQAQASLQERKDEIEDLNEQLQRAMTETYHRVKNNLQVVASLVSLQIQDGDENIPADELRRLNQHIQALAAINDLLTQQSRQDGTVSVLSSSNTIDKLLSLIPATIGNRHIRCDVETIPFTIKQGTALALLINELISNAVKHGRGPIDLILTQHDGMAELEVCDDGPGFPPIFNAAVAANTGLELVENLSRWDLRGSVTYQNREAGGGRVVVTFPIAAEMTEPLFSVQTARK